jgi:hypothetical protein
MERYRAYMTPQMNMMIPITHPADANDDDDQEHADDDDDDDDDAYVRVEAGPLIAALNLEPMPPQPRRQR